MKSCLKGIISEILMMDINRRPDSAAFAIELKKADTLIAQRSAIRVSVVCSLLLKRFLPNLYLINLKKAQRHAARVISINLQFQNSRHL